jgi:RNA 2',3'-cyclic 3'-phosphodiesterase
VNAADSVESGDSVRLFCALTLPARVLGRLVAWQARISPGRFRLVPRDNLHVTLAFLGSRPAGDVESIRAELEAAAAGARAIVLRELRYRETRSVGMLVFDDDDGAAGELARGLHERLRRLGVYEPEQRPWLPHLTVVRFRERPRLTPELPGLGAFSPSGAAVYHSLLRRTGAEYVVLHAVELCRL